VHYPRGRLRLRAVVEGVKVVRGEFCGEEGTVHKKDLENEVVYVQLEDELQIHKLEFDVT